MAATMREPWSSEAIRWGMIADDLTGACDAAAPFAQRGFQTLVVLDRDQPLARPAELTSIFTDSRDDSPETAGAKVREAGRWLSERGIPLIYKKIDSTLRGNLVAEIEAALGTSRASSVVLTPAFPAMGRTLAGGQLFVHGSLTSPPIHLPSLFANCEGVDVADAESEEDLAALAMAALRQQQRPLLAGSAGLATALAETLAKKLGREAPRPAPAASDPVVLLIGSRHPATLAQLDELKKNRAVKEWRLDASQSGPPDPANSVLVRIPPDPVTPGAIDALLRALEAFPRAGFVLSGGDTAALVCRAAGVESIELLGEIVPGIPWGRLCGGRWHQRWVATKAGGYGPPGALAMIADFLSGTRGAHAG